MPTLESVAALDKPLFVMLKGEPGTRKSTTALSFPGKQYWISTDQKMEALELPAKRWGLWGKNHLDYDDYQDWDRPCAKLEQLKVNCPYKTIVVDSITSLGDNINRQTINYKKNAKGDEAGKGKKIGNIYVPGLEEYNAEASSFQDLMARLKDIHKFHRVNIILIAHVVGQRQDNEKNKLTHHSRVIITGGDKISGKIASYMTEVYHFNVETDFNIDSGEGGFSVFTQHLGNDYARTSLPLERKITFNSDPLYDKWIAPAIKKLYEEKPIQRITTTTPSEKPQTPTHIPQQNTPQPSTTFIKET